MSEEHILRYTDLAAVIQMAKARGWSTSQIVRVMSAALPRSSKVGQESRAIAGSIRGRVYAAAEKRLNSSLFETIQ
jgi:hypothetical protein